MALSLCMKRMVKEREKLEQPNYDYFVFFQDDNLRELHAYVIGPKDTLYEHKFVKLKFNIPDRYPLVPPICKFIQHTGGRIHPNLYVEGKVCLSILGTWAGEPWALAMSIETVLITIRSLLDNEPYKHEPSQANNPGYNMFVQYGSWTWLLADYLKRETHGAALSFLQRYVAQNGDKILADLQSQHITNGNHRLLTAPYGGSSSSIVPNYPKLLREITKVVAECRAIHPLEQQLNYQPEIQKQQEEEEVMAEAHISSAADSTNMNFVARDTAYIHKPQQSPFPTMMSNMSGTDAGGLTVNSSSPADTRTEE